MASYVINYKIPTGNFQRPVQVKQQNESNVPHSKPTSTRPFFLQRPTISAELASRLIPIDVDLHNKKNTEEHHTNHYDISGLVLRRGQEFSFTVTFNRDFNPEEYQLYVRLATGSRSMISKQTQVRILADGKKNENGWSAKVLPKENKEKEEEEGKPKKNNQISLQIESPSNAIVGKYTLLLEVQPIKKKEEEEEKEKEKKEPTPNQNLTLFLFEVDIYFLFNPWNKDDACALSSPEQISEYVMNEHGQIYLGTSDKPQPVPWYFGQFERSALVAALAILDQAQLPEQNRIDPSVILRILASKICSNPGTNSGIFPSSFNNPTASSENNGYTSSSIILKQYILANNRAIKGGSGNNWQHAAVLCSLSRALGVPCRLVTVYNAALRADGTENNDIHWDTKQRPLRRLNLDTICSAHVWNECWMRRDDLVDKKQDWQIIDSTPVQMCDGVRRSGPCSVSSLKNGQLGFRWDSPFIHSSITGNKKHWIVYPDGNMDLLDVQENQIGTKILTRSLTNEFEPEDLTNHYKSSEKKEKSTTQKKNDVDFELKLPEEISFGDNITLELTAKNKSKEKRTITTALTICLTNSTGQKVISCFDQPIQTSNLESEKDDKIQLKISPEQYVNRDKEENLIVKYYIHSQIKETNQIFTQDDSIVFNKAYIIKPNLREDVVEVGKPVLLEIQIANTLSRPFSSGHLYIDGLGINQIIPVNRSFAPKESSAVQAKVYPRRIGVSRLYVTFISADICSLTQSIPLEIISEPLKTPDEPLLKNTTEASKESEKKSEEKSKEEVKSKATPDDKEKSSAEKEEKPSTTTAPVEDKKQDKKEEDKKEEKKEDKKEDKKEEDKKEEKKEDKKEDKKEEKPSTTTTPVEDKKQDEKEEKKEEKKTPEKPPSDTEGEDKDDVDELGLKKKPNIGTNPSIPHGSTLSLDKDKMSIDSLDISNDRRHLPNNNNNNNQ